MDTDDVVVRVIDWTYFVREEGEGGAIKVGHAFDPVGRRTSLQIGNPRLLVLIACFHGGEPREQEILAELAEHRIRGEWLAPTAEVLAMVERCMAEDEYSWNPVERAEERLSGQVYPPRVLRAQAWRRRLWEERRAAEREAGIVASLPVLYAPVQDADGVWSWREA